MSNFVPDSEPRDIRFALEATGLVGAVGQSYLSFGISGAAQGGGYAVLTAPLFSVSGSGVVGAVGTAELSLSRNAFVLSATGSADEVGSAILTFPPFVSLYGILRESAAPFSLRATGSAIVTAVYSAYSINLSNSALTKYPAFSFDFVIRYQGKQYGAYNGTLYLLEGDKDVAAPIAAVIETAPSDFKSSMMKRMPYVYVGVKGNEKLLVTATADEQTAIASSTATVGRTRRARLARGTKGRFWSVTIANVNGEDFAIDSLEMLPMMLSRKV